MESSLFLVRHGETEWNLSCRFQGQLDSPLTEKGVRQVQQLAEFFAKVQVGKMFSSPIGRALETARMIKRQQIKCRLEMDEHLKEISFGSFARSTREELEKIHPGLWESREKNKWEFRWLNGESYADVYQRVGDFIADNAGDLVSGKAIIVAHETVNKVLIGRLLTLPRQQILRLRHPHGVIIRWRGLKQSRQVEHIDITVASPTWQAGLVYKT